MTDHIYPTETFVVFETHWGAIESAEVLRHDDPDDDGTPMYLLMDTDDQTHHVREDEIYRPDHELNAYRQMIQGWLGL